MIKNFEFVFFQSKSNFLYYRKQKNLGFHKKLKTNKKKKILIIRTIYLFISGIFFRYNYFLRKTKFLISLNKK